MGKTRDVCANRESAIARPKCMSDLDSWFSIPGNQKPTHHSPPQLEFCNEVANLLASSLHQPVLTNCVSECLVASRGCRPFSICDWLESRLWSVLYDKNPTSQLASHEGEGVGTDRTVLPRLSFPVVCLMSVRVFLSLSICGFLSHLLPLYSIRSDCPSCCESPPPSLSLFPPP